VSDSGGWRMSLRWVR